MSAAAEKEKLVALANSSGFLLQLRVESLIRSTVDEHRWDVVSREHPWKHGSDSSGYVDLVLGRDNTRLVVECKRSQHGNWLFLHPNHERKEGQRLVGYWARRMGDGHHHGGYFDFALRTSMPVSEFCVIRGSSDDRTALLDRLGAQLVLCGEALGFQDPFQAAHVRYERIRIYIPIVVTNSLVQVARFPVDDVDLSTGKLSDTDIETVPFLIYNKSLSFPGTGPHEHLGAIARQTMRSVIVVHANSLPAFLQQFEIVYDHSRGYWPWSI